MTARPMNKIHPKRPLEQLGVRGGRVVPGLA